AGFQYPAALLKHARSQKLPSFSPHPAPARKRCQNRMACQKSQGYFSNSVKACAWEVPENGRLLALKSSRNLLG
ncbi:TPA: hypothetical protein ACF21E_004742, partial [Escherichia coli]